jgi:hypothetical protein
METDERLPAAGDLEVQLAVFFGATARNSLTTSAQAAGRLQEGIFTRYRAGVHEFPWLAE